MRRRALLATTSVRTIPGTGRATGAYASELAETWAVLRGSGLEVEVAAVAGGEVPLESVQDGDAVQAAMLADPAMAAWLGAAPRPRDLSGGEYAAVVLIGGHGAAWDMGEDGGLARLVTSVHAGGGVVGAVCHGQAGLLGARRPDGAPLVAGRRVAAFTEDEERVVGMLDLVPFLLGEALARRGAEHDAGPSFMPHVVVDGRLITGQNPASARGVAEAVVTALSPLIPAPTRDRLPLPGGQA